MTDKMIEIQKQAEINYNQLANSINNPMNINSQQSAQILITQFKKLCDLQYPCCFVFDGNANCILCEKYIGNDKYITLNCSHNVHVECGKTKVLSISKALDTEIYIECNICKQLWDHDNIVQLFGKQEYERIQEEATQELIQQIQNVQQFQSRIREQNYQFTCDICFEKKYVNDDCITLDCDHRFCKECTNQFISEGFKSGKMREEELVCPQCSNSIPPQILQTFLSKQQFDQISERRLFEKQDAQYKYVRCPMKLNEQDCLTILEIEIDAKSVVCPFCTKEFCVNGCSNPHPNITCEKYRQWERENGMGDQSFETFVQQQNIARCSKCQMFVQKNQGCNHMTCRCKHEFCYVCNKNWKPRTCAH